jgi:hypothetical protein
MKPPDYYSVMEERIKYLKGKYDPLNKFGNEWEAKRNDMIIETNLEPETRQRPPRRILQLVNAFLALFF